MEKIFTSLKLPGIFILLTSALASYWNYPALETYDYPKDQEELTGNWFESPMGIFSLSYSESSLNPTISAPGNIQNSTDSGSCTAIISLTDVDYTGDSLSWEMTGATTDTGTGQVGTYTFPLGTTTLTFTVTGDETTVTDSMTVTVSDNQNPTITAPADFDVNSDNNSCSASGVNLGTPTTADNCGVKSVSSDAPSVFPIGTTTVTWTVIDDSDNTATATQIITVSDNQKPTITAPANVAVNTDANQCTASGVNLGTSTTSDNCEVDTTVASVDGAAIDPATYAFPIGTTTVTWTVTDKSGLTATATQQVTVTDDENPTITAPAAKNITTSNDSTGNCTTTVALGTPTTSDNCEVDTTVASVDGAAIDPATYAFPIGTTTVTWTVTDKAGLTATATQEVIVTDDENPTITAPAAKNITTSNDSTGNCTTTVALGTPTTSDNCEVDTTVASVDGAAIDSATYEFPIGTTTVTWTVTDKSGLTATATQQVTVTDDENPTITAPAARNITTSNDSTGNCTTTVALGTPTTSDNCEVDTTVASVDGAAIDPATYAFPIGTTTVTWTVTDKAGLTATATQEVTVSDNENPTITAPAAKNITTSNDSTGNCTTTVVLGTPTTSDNCEVVTTVASVDGSAIDPATYAFPIGTTTVTWTVKDKAGLTATATQLVTVKDDERPIISAGTDITIPNITGHCYAGPSITTATASDNCSVGTPTGTRSDGQPLNTTYPVGTTTITWTVTDANGNTAEPVIQNIVVEDKEAPELPNLEDVTWGCAYTFEAPTTFDNCDNVITATTLQSTTFSTSGAITWTFQDAAGNTTTATQNITIDPVKIAPVEVVNVLCNGNATGAITVAASGGVPPFTYDWGSLGAGDTKTDLSAGVFSVRAFDANGCETETLQITVSEPASFIEVINVRTTSGCFGQNNGTAYAEAKGGTPGYTYKWSNGQTTQTATGLAPGNHTVTITDANGCSAERTVTVSQPTELKISGFLTTETTSYGSATGTATAQVSGGTPNYTFSWSNGLSGQTAQGLAAGKYTVTVTDANGCTATKEVVIIDSLEANIVPISICETGSIIRTSYFEVENGTARGGVGPYTYSWNFGANATPATATGIGKHKVTYDTAEEKLITLTVTDSQGRTFSQSVLQNVAGCFSDTCGSNDLGLDNYFIGDINMNRITSENCNSIDEKFIYIDFPTNSERYSLYIELIYSVRKIDSDIVQHYKVQDCFYQLQGIPDIARTFSIDYECGDAIKIEGIYLTFQNNKTRACGATEGNGNHPKCYSTNNEATVISPLYAVALPNELLCNGGETGIITAKASGGSGTYTYKLISATDGSVVRTAQTANTFTGLPAGRYKVVVNDGSSNFTTAEAEIKQPTNTLALALTAQTEITCYGGSDGSATVEASGGTPATTGDPYIYIWEGIGQTTATATNLSAGTYKVRVLDANGCEAFLDVEILQPDEIPASAGPDQILECGNSSTFLAAVFDPVVAEGESAPQGTWSIVNGPAGGVIENVNDPQSKFTGNIGTYTLRWTVPCGASDDVKISISSCSTLDFDGVNDHVVIGDKFDLPSAFTIEAWVKQDAGKTSGIKTVLSKRDNSALASGGFDLIVDNNVPKFRWNSSEIASTYPIGTDRWYHLAVIVGGDNAGLYVDGIKTSTTAPGAPNPISAPVMIGAAGTSATPAPENYFHGWIEEVRFWNRSLQLDQVKFLMNQRLKVGSSPLRGMILPLDVPGPLDFNEDLIAYYPLIVSEITNGTTLDKTPNAHHGKMINITTLQQNTAPLPYYSAKDGQWIADGTWLRPAVWDHPNSRGVDGATMIDWNIVVTKHNITSQAKDIRVLGLLSETEQKRLTIANPTGPQNETNTGQALSVSHYLLLNGIIDLVGESQLLQDVDSYLDPGSKGYLERDQQGKASSYTYNYWTSPVSPGINAPYFVKGTMKDGTITTFRELVFGTQYHFADGNYSDPRKISNYWLHKFHGTANNYFSWEHIGHTGTLAVGEGFSMKGTSGWAGNNDLQNYTFVGLPNNGEISLSINNTNEGENYLVGNPYPSSLDAEKFILDNIILNDPSNSAFNGTLYFWDHFSKTTHYLEHYIGGYAVFNLGGSIEPASSVDSRIDNSDPSKSGSKRPGDFIPVGQAFFVNTVINPGEETPATTGRKTLIFNNDQRIYKRENRDNVIFFGSEKKDKSTTKASEERQRIWIKFQSPKGYHRQILVTADARTSNGFDLGFDAPLIDNNIEDMYWLMNKNVELVIQGVPDFNADRILPLGIKTAEGGKFVIKIDELQNIGDEFAIYVKDNQTGTYYNLRDGEFTGTAEKGNIHERYSIVFSSEKDPNSGEENPDEDGDNEEGEGDTGNGDGDGDSGSEEGDGEGIEVTKPEQPQPTPPADIELLYSNRDGNVIIQNSGMLPVQKAVLYNSLGQELFTFGNIPVQNFTELPIDVPSTGVYYIKVHLKDYTRSLKFIVE